MPIVTVPTGNDYSRMTAELINASWDQAIGKQSAFETKISNAAGTYLDETTPPSMTAAQVSPIPTVAEPAVDIPATASTTDIMNLYDTKYLELVQLLSDKFVAFRTTYFPDEQNAYTAAEDSLQAALASNTYIPAAVQDQIFTDERDRVLAEADRAQADVLATFANRRFPLPPGAATSAVLQIQQTAQDKIAEAGRKITAMSVEQYRFVVEKTLGLREKAMDAAIDYIKALASGPDMASRLINVGYDAQSKLISAAASFYNARTEAAKLTHSAYQHNADLTQDAAKENLRSELTIIEDKLRALLAEAQALAQMATSLFNNLHAQAGVSASDNVNSTV